VSRSFKIAIALLTIPAGVFAYLVLMEYRSHEEHGKISKRQARHTLSQIADSARNYWEQHASFPESVGYTPALGTCCKSDDPPFCSPRGDRWDAPTWRALEIMVGDKNAYSYAFDSNTAGDAVTFTARARGDLDCDEMLATYEIYGDFDADGSLRVSPLYRVQELE
jgi:hypothetical protein